MASLFNIGVGGLRAQQSALNVVGQNITNASTPGYSRQRVELEAIGGGSIEGLLGAAGARVTGAVRVVDPFIADQIRADMSLTGELRTLNERIRQAEAVLYDDENGLDQSIQSFFAALENASVDPSNLALREFVLSSAKSLGLRFNGIAERLNTEADAVATSVDSVLQRINDLATNLGQLNGRIAELQDGRSSAALNAMLDQRESVLKEMSGLVGVTVIEQDDGQMNVLLGKGHTLVLGHRIGTLSMTNDGSVLLQPFDSKRKENVTGSVNGGELGGLISYREDVLGAAQNKLGRIAAAISSTVNEQHKLGVDLNGNFGGDVFRDVNSADLVRHRVEYLSNELGSPNKGQVNVYVEDVTEVPASDYVVRFSSVDDGAFTITREEDGALVYQGILLGDAQTVAFDGLRVEFENNDFVPGSALKIRPFAAFSENFGSVLNDPAQLALAAPVTAAPDRANRGSATVAVDAATQSEHGIYAAPGELSPPITIEFVTEDRYRLWDASDPTNPQPLQPDLGVLSMSAFSGLLPKEGSTLVRSHGAAVNQLVNPPGFSATLDAGDNGYPAGSVTFADGVDDYRIDLDANLSAREIAASLSGVPGVQGLATTEVTLTDLQTLPGGTPLEVSINGRILTDFSTLGELADAISADEQLNSAGIRAVSDGTSLTLTSIYGDDLNIALQGDASESVMVKGEDGATSELRGSVLGSYDTLTVGGRVRVVMDAGIDMQAQLPGIFAANPIQEAAGFGMQLTLNGNVEVGDRYHVAFNTDGVADNRNALDLAQLGEALFIGDPPRTFAGLYGNLVQDIGSQASQVQINHDAAKSLLQQSESIRESVSGVNLDEEAADLIRYEQAYNASAQVISVARDIFNVLLNSVA